MSWPRRIGAIFQVLTGQIKPPHSVPDTCSKLAICALFLLSADGLYSLCAPGDESTDEECSDEEVEWSDDDVAEEAENEWGRPKPSIGGGIGHDEDW